MYRKIQRFVSGLVSAVLFIAGSALIGQPLPSQSGFDLDASTSQQTEASSVDAGEQLLRLKARIGLSMPYYSFGASLPRTRGS
jgi:hypothetical protein